MTREIKFRAWTGDKMITPDCIIFNECEDLHIEYDNGKGLCNPILMQYTGLKDKNGKEIYEGDYSKSETELYLVVFKDGLFGYNIYDLNNDGSWSFIEFEDMGCYYYNEMDFTLNIYENLELLNG
jgi:uncharacterized phage protein (TIGR01671 family)